MSENTAIINLDETDMGPLPLGFKKIYREKIPALDIKSKLLLYNQKYKSHTMEATGPHKPISKILT
jgi:hypothetical protein